MPVSRVSVAYLSGLAVGGFVAMCATVFVLRSPVVTAQSATWTVVSEPEPVAGVNLSIVQHVSGECVLIVQGEKSIAVWSFHAGCPDKTEARANHPDLTEEQFMEIVASEVVGVGGRIYLDEKTTAAYEAQRRKNQSQPSAGETTKYPGVRQP